MASLDLDPIRHTAAYSKRAERLRELILKLRWIGMENEAERVSSQLPKEIIVISPPETD
jgi:hypothetical protein